MLPASDNPFLILRKLRWYSASFIITIIVIIMPRVVGLCCHIFVELIHRFLAALVQPIKFCRSEIYSWVCMKKKLLRCIRVKIEENLIQNQFLGE